MQLKQMLNEIINANEDLKVYYNSDQFLMSEKILKKKMELNLNQEEFAELLGLDLDDYIDYEFGSENIEVAKYHEILAKISVVEKELSTTTFKVSNNYFKLDYFNAPIFDNFETKKYYNVYFKEDITFIDSCCTNYLTKLLTKLLTKKNLPKQNFKLIKDSKIKIDLNDKLNTNASVTTQNNIGKYQLIDAA